MRIHSEYFIRSATNDDIPSIKKVVFTALREYGLKPDEHGKDKDLNDIQKNYFDQHGFFGVLIHKISYEVVGTFGVSDKSQGICELRKMFLRKEDRGKGLGKAMLEEALRFARENGYHKMQLESIAVLKEAVSLYESYGFVEIPPVEVNARVDCAYELNIR